jgi:two-component system OmpR family sensor kinase
MSIRLRLTLLYSAILALTLLFFGLALYTIQAQESLNSLKTDLVASSGGLVEAALRTEHEPPTANTGQRPPPPRPFEDFSGEPAFQELREREIARILDSQGNLLASPFGREDDALPLSEEALAALQDQQEFWEDDVVSDEHMLIYNRPIVRDQQTVFIVQVARSLIERDRNLQTLATTLFVGGMITILLAFGVGWWLSGQSLRPIKRITQTAQTIGDERDFTRRVDYSGPQDEVGQLASTFNQMLTRLQEAYQKVEHALAMQRNFVADVSHELRTPLTTLRGNVGLLSRVPPIPSEEKADILADVVEESDRMIRLVNDLLLLAHADARRGLAKERLSLQPLLEESVRQASHLAVDRKIKLESSPGISILGDRDAFKQIMLILLDNGLKHSDDDVCVMAERYNEQVEIRVQDHGPGIAADKLDKVFDRFYRGDEVTTTPGFGLGLPICKALTEGMGGNIAIDSEVGKGSTIRLRFQATNELERDSESNGL